MAGYPPPPGRSIHKVERQVLGEQQQVFVNLLMERWLHKKISHATRTGKLAVTGHLANNPNVLLWRLDQRLQDILKKNNKSSKLVEILEAIQALKAKLEHKDERDHHEEFYSPTNKDLGPDFPATTHSPTRTPVSASAIVPQAANNLSRVLMLSSHFNASAEDRLSLVWYAGDALAHLTSLNLSRNGLVTLPPAIAKMYFLTTLNLRFNLISSLPVETARLRDLTYLNLSHNRVSTINDEVARALTNLTHLDLSGNCIKETTPSLCRLCHGVKWVGLHSMELLHENLTLTQSVKMFYRAREIRLQNSHIARTLPVAVGAWRDARIIHLEANTLQHLPDEIARWACVEELYLHDNRFVMLPETVGHLTSLVVLDLKNNVLSALPHGIGGLVSLTELHAASNNLASLPKAISGLSSLRDLELTENLLQALPSAIGSLVSLRRLDLMGNYLSRLPDAIGNLGNLKSLALRNNSLTGLPSSIGGLTALTLLTLDNNKLRVLPSSFGQLTALQELYLSNNLIDEVPSSLGNLHNLTYLYLNNNLLKSIPASIGQLDRLSRIDLFNNPLDKIVRHVWMLGVSSLLEYLRDPSSFGHLVQRRRTSSAPEPFIENVRFGFSEHDNGLLLEESGRLLGMPGDLPQPRADPEDSFSKHYRQEEGSGSVGASGASYLSNASAVDPTQNNTPLGNPLSDVEIDFLTLTLGGKLGEGAFGAVFASRLDTGAEVAVKLLKYKVLDQRVLQQLRQEVAILSKLHHPNVVSLIGACLQPPNLCIVTELCSGGSLYALLHEQHEKIYLTWLLKIGLDVAEGMNYLHKSRPKIIHRDLSSHNILIGQLTGGTTTAKIVDFGLACIKEGTGLIQGEAGNVRWVAPEVLRGQGYDEKADVYSFGLVLWEIYTGLKPYFDTPDARDVVHIVASGIRPAVPPACPPFLDSLITSCWDDDAAKRCDFDDVVRTLMRQDRANRRKSLAGPLGELLVDYL